MSTSQDFIEFVADQICGTGEIRYRKMFGEYMLYVNNKPILLVCDDTVYVKILPELEEILKDAETGNPYPSAKPHYILDIDNQELSRQVIAILEPITKVPVKRKPKG